MKKKSHNCNRRLQEGFQILAFAKEIKVKRSGTFKDDSIIIQGDYR
jgi:hypothetical protein